MGWPTAALQVSIPAEPYEGAMVPIHEHRHGGTNAISNHGPGDDLATSSSEVPPSAKAWSELERLFLVHARAMCEEANRILGDPDNAEDVVQRIFVRIGARWGEYVGKEITRAYLVRAARNEAFSIARRRRPEEPLKPAVVRSLADPQRDQLERLMRAERRRILDHWIETLPPRCREVVIRIVRDHKNHREVAQALGITVKAVEKQMARAYRLARRAAVDGSYQMARRSGGVHKKGRGGGA